MTQPQTTTIPNLSDMRLLFGTGVAEEALLMGLKRLRVVPEKSGMNDEREKQAADNVRRFLRAVFPETLFLVKFAGRQTLNLQTLRVHWPQMPDSPPHKVVENLLAPFTERVVVWPEEQREAVASFQKTFGNLFLIELKPRPPIAHDRFWQAKRRETLLSGAMSTKGVPPKAAKPRM